YLGERKPQPDRRLAGEDGIKIKTFGKDEVELAKNTVVLRGLEQLKDEEQTRALGYLLKELLIKGFDGRKSLAQAVDVLEQALDEKGLETLFRQGDVAASLARPRRQEIMACVARYRGIKF
ncbi:MAG: isopentenyl-diphosphate delta-isomerase, partial [Acetatifactor sp.]|nr:isopentenyl-diphosphate delta-isomerase [Acetatifactor sp.]